MYSAPAAQQSNDLRSRMTKIEHAPSHPVETIERSWRERELDSKLNMLGNVYGSFMPMQKRMEARIVSSMNRGPGLPSSNFGLEILMNKHEDIEWDDFLNDPQYSADSVDMHVAMEKQLGLDKLAGKSVLALRGARAEGSLRANHASVTNL